MHSACVPHDSPMLRICILRLFPALFLFLTVIDLSIPILPHSFKLSAVFTVLLQPQAMLPRWRC